MGFKNGGGGFEEYSWMKINFRMDGRSGYLPDGCIVACGECIYTERKFNRIEE